MKLVTLVGILALIFALVCLFCKSSESFTPSPYLVSWQKPADNGGDEGCCGYDWQINDGNTDKGSVPTGTGASITVQTTKLDWNTTYKISVRAVNMFGPGDWTVVNLSTGNGVLSAIKMAAAFDASGNITTPISATTPQNISIWSAMNKGVANPNTLKASALVTVRRLIALGPATTTVLEQRIELDSSYDTANSLDVFSGDFASQMLPPFSFQSGDILSATIIVWDPNDTVITEGYGELTVTQGTPSNVSDISLSYIR